MEQLGVSSGDYGNTLFLQLQVFDIQRLGSLRKLCQIDLDRVKQMCRVCFVMNLGDLRFEDTLNDFFIYKGDRNGCGYNFTCDQCLEIQCQDLFAQRIVINIFYQGIDLFTCDIQHGLCTLFGFFNEAQGILFCVFQSYIFFHLTTI